MTTYNLTVVNNSNESWDMYTFQKNPASSIGNPQLRSLAWFTKATAAQSIATFTWDLTYNFMWSETGTLIPGVVFRASQSFPADPSRNGVSSRNSAGNQAFLTYNASRNFFEYSTSSAIEPIPGASAGTLYVDSDATVPNGIASVGIGMSNAGTFALPAILSKDQRLHAWCGYPASQADNWGRPVGLGDGSLTSATERLLHALSYVGDNEPLCLFAHGSDTAIGDAGSGPYDWTWTVDDIAVILAMTLGQRGYTGPILIQACADSITNFSTHLALALSRQRALVGVWLYGYNKPVPIVQVFPAPSQLDKNVELQPVQVT